VNQHSKLVKEQSSSGKTAGSDTILNKTIMANAFAAPKLWHNPLNNAWMLDDVG